MQVAFFPLAVVTVIVAVPLALAVTFPLASTVATLLLFVDHFKVVFALDGVIVLTNCFVAPAVIVKDVLFKVIDLTATLLLDGDEDGDVDGLLDGDTDADGDGETDGDTEGDGSVEGVTEEVGELDGVLVGELDGELDGVGCSGTFETSATLDCSSPFSSTTTTFIFDPSEVDNLYLEIKNFLLL